MRKPRLATTPPKLTPLLGRASPKGSKNYGGLGKGIDMPNQSQNLMTASPLGLASSKASYKHDVPQLGEIKFG